jgi:hypothetical protein
MTATQLSPIKLPPNNINQIWLLAIGFTGFKLASWFLGAMAGRNWWKGLGAIGWVDSGLGVLMKSMFSARFKWIGGVKFRELDDSVEI